MSKRTLYLILAGAVLLGLIGWRFVDKRNSAQGLASMQRQRGAGGANVVLATAGPLKLISSIDSSANLESPFDVKLSPKVTGRIAQVLVREGMRVMPGELLATTDPSDVESQILQMRAAVAEARSKLAQGQMGQAGNDAGVRASLRQQQASVDAARADLDQTQQGVASKIASDAAAVADAEAKLRSAQADYDTARANQDNAQTKLDRVTSLYKQGFIAAQDVDDAKTALKAAQNASASAQQRIGSAQAARDSVLQVAEANKRKYRSDVTASNARLVQGQASLAVAGANQSQTAAYRESVAALRAGLEAAQAQLRQAEAHRGDVFLRSPIEGTVTGRFLDPGSLGNPNQPIVEVQFLKWLYVVAPVPVDQGAGVRVGMPVVVTFDGLPGRTFESTVTLLNPAADPATRQFTIQARLENPDGVLRPGMFGKLSLITREVDAKVALPREALRGDSVFVVDDQGVAHKTPVTLGFSDNANVEIASGLRAGEKVVVQSYQPLREGMKIRMAAPGASGEAASGGASGGPRGSGKAGGGRRSKGGSGDGGKGS
ncbi:MAG: efflux RND transporter periplasmic adaptor subunit [Fimbriimonas ginsengisoli]|uniref:Efflux RND transporter periplasmic adaptor subunit n=1 Tax=Fimbriimonas ginsengisoli TaxID=1005039 RepID=A0A931LU95_FIMGI|nr:efflux RND transporter periplasmic adaptor subunit [Fimbriimonas ginsengisoli]